jgi:hypothetical protein
VLTWIPTVGMHARIAGIEVGAGWFSSFSITEGGGISDGWYGWQAVGVVGALIVAKELQAGRIFPHGVLGADAAGGNAGTSQAEMDGSGWW